MSSLNEMAMSRAKWQDKVRNVLTGSLKEYTKLIIARRLGHKDFWSNEVRALLKTAKFYIQDSVTRTDFDRDTALKEVFKEASDNSKVVAAKNEYIKHYELQWREIKAMELDAHKLMTDMFAEFLPEVKL